MKATKENHTKHMDVIVTRDHQGKNNVAFQINDYVRTFQQIIVKA
jgi:hypothetical protein